MSFSYSIWIILLSASYERNVSLHYLKSFLLFNTLLLFLGSFRSKQIQQKLNKIYHSQTNFGQNFILYHVSKHFLALLLVHTWIKFYANLLALSDVYSLKRVVRKVLKYAMRLLICTIS